LNINNSEIIDFRLNRIDSVKKNGVLPLLWLAFTTMGLKVTNFFYTPLKKLLLNHSPTPLKKAVILGFGGIGNHLMLTPAIKALRKSFPGINIHLVVASRACCEIFLNNADINSMSVIHLGLMNKLFQYIQAGQSLRKFRPDVVIAAAGTDPVAGSIVALTSGAPFRVGEDWRGRGILYSKAIKVNSQVSEIEQNAKIFGLAGAKNIKGNPRLNIGEDESRAACRWIEELRFPPNSKIIGIHPGSGHGQVWKRWGIDNFVEVTKIISERPDVRVVYFLGPDEYELFNFLSTNKPVSTTISKSNGSLLETAAKIGQCHLFLSNDSGLRHIAQAMNVKSIGIFGPTSDVKNHYGGPDHKIISNRNALCRPCHFTAWWLTCGGSRPCLKSIDSEYIARVIMDWI